MRPYSPGGVLNALASAPQGSIPATPSTHRLRRGLPGYLILFAPHAFASQRQCRSRRPLSPPVFLPISTNFTSTPGILPPSPALKASSSKCTSSVEPRAFTPRLPCPPTRALRPVIPSNVSTLRLTAAAGTELAGAFWKGTVMPGRYCSPWCFVPLPQGFTTRRPSSPTRRRCVRVSPIAQYSPLLPPVGVWTVSQFQCGWPSSQTSYPSLPR